MPTISRVIERSHTPQNMTNHSQESESEHKSVSRPISPHDFRSNFSSRLVQASALRDRSKYNTVVCNTVELDTSMSRSIDELHPTNGTFDAREEQRETQSINKIIENF